MSWLFRSHVSTMYDIQTIMFSYNRTCLICSCPMKYEHLLLISWPYWILSCKCIKIVSLNHKLHTGLSYGMKLMEYMLCDVTWSDLIWCDVMWYDVMWCDVTRRDVMWCDVMWCDVMWCDVMWCDVMWCDAMRCDAMLCDVTWSDVTCDVVWCYVQWSTFSYVNARRSIRLRAQPMCILSCIFSNHELWKVPSVLFIDK